MTLSLAWVMVSIGTKEALVGFAFVWITAVLDAYCYGMLFDALKTRWSKR